MYSAPPSSVADALLLRGHVLDVVDLAAGSYRRGWPERRPTTISSATSKLTTLSDARDLLEGFGLGDSAGEAVEDPADFSVGGCEALLDEGDGQIVRHEPTRGEDTLHLEAQGRLVLDRRAEKVARGDMRQLEGFHREVGYRALARSGRSQEYQFHGLRPPGITITETGRRVNLRPGAAAASEPGYFAV